MYDQFDRPVTARPSPPVRVVGNWIMGMWELYVREPTAERYAMFQDDIVVVKNLREFLDKSPYPKKGYLNLITHEANVQHTRGEPGWHKSNMRGLGACALVFDREALQLCLGSKHMANKPASAAPMRAWKYLDGGIVEAMKMQKWMEWIHNPSLVQHIGQDSTIGNNGSVFAKPLRTFPGEGFDALEML
jgi:hypothetical protein